MKASTVYLRGVCTTFLCFLILFSWAQEPIFAPGRIIVKFREGVVFRVPAKKETPVQFNIEKIDMLNHAYACTKARQIMQSRHDPRTSRYFLLYFPVNADVPALVQEYMNTGFFEYAEPDMVVKSVGTIDTLLMPGDLYFYHQWNLFNDGSFTFGPAKAGADIRMLDAWQIEQGDSNIVASIIDTGGDTDHPELTSRIWINGDEIPDNGVDDDMNGFIDDIHGWNFAYDTNDVEDDMFHGTATAGVIGAASNNGFGLAGVDWHCKLQMIKVLDANGSGFISDIADGIYYAVDNGGKVINMSLGGSESQVEGDAVAYAYDHHVTIVAASGNSNGSLLYPAAYNTVIAVGSTSANDERTHPFYFGDPGSSYGSNLSVVAPGDMVPLLWLDHHFDYGAYGCGTSFSTPHVVGICTLLLAQDSTRTPDSLKAIIMRTADDLVGDPREDTPGWDKYYGAGRVNAYRALSDKKSVMGISSFHPRLLSIYPNPVAGITYVKIPGISGPLKGSLTIANATGEIYGQIPVNGFPAQVDFSQLPKGLYIITFSDGVTRWCGKAVRF